MAKTLELDRCCKELIEPESDIASQALRRWPPPLQELHCPVDSAMVSSLHGCADKVGIFLPVNAFHEFFAPVGMHLVVIACSLQFYETTASMNSSCVNRVRRAMFRFRCSIHIQGSTVTSHTCFADRVFSILRRILLFRFSVSLPNSVVFPPFFLFLGLFILFAPATANGMHKRVQQ